MIAISSPRLSLLSLQEALAAVQPGFRAWEIVAEGKHYLPGIAKELEEFLASHDLDCSVHAPLSDVNIGSLNPRLREVALREVMVTIEQAGALGLDPVTVHPGFYTPLGQLERDGARRATRDALCAMDKIAKDCGVKVALENMPAMPISMVTDPKGLLDLLEGTELGICFDIGHANTTHNIDDYLALTTRFHNVHFHDNQGQYDQHLVIGEGTVPFASALAKMDGYKGRFVIEARGMDGALTSRDRLQALLRAAHFL
jgi:sugar phosphate isomerase/epimerase